METVISKIRALVHTGKRGERAISTFIIEQGFDLSAMSATRVAQALEISDSTVIRYARMLGCKGFPDLKLQLAAAKPDSAVVRQEIYEGIEAGDSTVQIVAKSKLLFTKKIEQSLDLIEPEVIDTCAQLLVNARRIVLVGIGSSAFIALDMNHKLIRCGLNVLFNYDYHTQLVQASLLRPGDVLLAISARGESEEVIEALSLARNNGAQTIALTRYGKNRASALAEHVIAYSYTEAHEKLGMVTPQILQMIAFDVLFFKINSLISHESMQTAMSAVDTHQKKRGQK
ncbi:MurR/RpiR family transcriptional regulator [uncultured Cedecea sp.]|uniref:MurR/RpiR family transcriptional regulator n=1 Tax=uncultured Cedecea sp. TaxID=988762 RepID=UPI002633511D|nr:MurR/RpiR family transcriptional regulator [uncultured Cedecea sp.]